MGTGASIHSTAGSRRNSVQYPDSRESDGTPKHRHASHGPRALGPLIPGRSRSSSYVRSNSIIRMSDPSLGPKLAGLFGDETKESIMNAQGRIMKALKTRKPSALTGDNIVKHTHPRPLTIER
jgi:hypothetical protein